MQETNKIRLNETESIHSKNVDSFSNIGLEQTTRIIPNVGINGIVDINNIFNSERDSCTNYRLTLTINPFCTNVLFNTCTEIVYKEGSDFQKPILDTSSENIQGVYGKNINVSRNDMVRNTEYSSERIGLYTYHPGMDIFNNHLLRNKTSKIITYINTQQYSTRNVFNTIDDYARDFNGMTVKFAPRIDFTSAAPYKIDKHHYTISDLHSFVNGESFNANAYEENGWIGFKNTTAMDVKDNTTQANPIIMDIGRVINNRGNCEFIDMYPDRSLFLFSPKYNHEREREEYNWDIEITYPYKNFYNHPLVREIQTDSNGNLVMENNRYVFGNTYGLLMQYGKATLDGNGRIITVFRSFVKHKLNRGVYLNVFYKIGGKGEYEKYSETIMVASIGDDERKNDEYFMKFTDDGLYHEIMTKHTLDLFYDPQPSPQNPNNYIVYTHIPEMIPSFISCANIAYYVYEPDHNPLSPEMYDETMTFDEIPYETLYTPTQIKVTDDLYTNYYVKSLKYYDLKPIFTSDDDIINKTIEIFNSTRFRIKRVVSEIESDYYFRIFRKLPNFKFTQENLDPEYVDNGEVFEKFIENNASYLDTSIGSNVMHKFDSEWYDLAFGKTIYGDQITQLSYSDLININNLVDNLGRPLTSIYATIIKKNSGHNLWYASLEDADYYDNLASDSIEYSHCFGKVTSGIPFLASKNDRNDNIRRLKGFMSDARCLRNTANGYQIPLPKSLEYWYSDGNDVDGVDGIKDNEFFGDLVDFNPVNAYEITLEKVNFRFNTEQRESDVTVIEHQLVMHSNEIVGDDYDFPIDGTHESGFTDVEDTYPESNIHPEGYIYEPHYEIKVRELSDFMQDSHYMLMVYNCEPISMDGIFLKIETSSTNKCSEGDEIFFCDDANEIWYKTNIVYIVNDKTIIANVIQPDSENYIDWIELTEKLLNGDFILRLRNKNIPKYAKMVGINDFVWRKINNVGDSKNVAIEEYPFTNGSFYVDKKINFYLKRQDPEGINKLYNHSTNETFIDYYGMKAKENNNESVNEGEMVC